MDPIIGGENTILILSYNKGCDMGLVENPYSSEILKLTKSVLIFQNDQQFKNLG